MDDDTEYLYIHPPKLFGGNPKHTIWMGPSVQRKAPDETTKPGGDIAGQAQPSDLPHNALGIDELEKGS